MARREKVWVEGGRRWQEGGAVAGCKEQVGLGAEVGSRGSQPPGGGLPAGSVQLLCCALVADAAAGWVHSVGSALTGSSAPAGP